jgi:hypothetical protein
MRRLKELERTFRHDPKRALGTDEDLRDVEPSGTLPRSTSSLDDLAVGENDGGVEEPFGFGGSVWTRRRNKAPRERMKKIWRRSGPSTNAEWGLIKGRESK